MPTQTQGSVLPKPPGAASTSPFVTISVKNDSSVVINAMISATFQNSEVRFNQGNYPQGDLKVFQLPAGATQISVDIKYEAFINDWRKVYSNTFSDTESWQTSNMSFSVSGPSGSVTYSGPNWS